MLKIKKTKSILWFREIGIKDVPIVGGKNAALGEMFSNLSRLGVRVTNGFAITAAAYRYFLKETGLDRQIKKALSGLDKKNLRDLQNRGKNVRELILRAELPADLAEEISAAYEKLGEIYGPHPDVAVRSSATAEDLPGASFAGAQETYLNVVGRVELLEAVKKCISSLFTDRAISYRVDKGFSHLSTALSVGVQKMVRSDLSSSGVMFTLDTETGFDKVVVINGVWGLGEMIVKGHVTPDEFLVFKPSLRSGHEAILSSRLGKKNVKLIYAQSGTKEVRVRTSEERQYCLKAREVETLARWGVKIEEYFSKKIGHYQPMDMEWAKDGKTGKLYIVQARPETVHSLDDKRVYLEYRLKTEGKVLLRAIAVGTKIASGKVKIIRDPKRISEFKPGEILVSEITDPDWEPIMKIASAIVTDKGGRTSHAAIVSRELGIPCVVGSKNGSKILRDGMDITVDCSSGETGRVLAGLQKFEVIKHNLGAVPKIRTKVMVNIGSPEDAFKNYYLPVSGVGLGRLEFIIASLIKIHPNLLLDYRKLASRKSHNTQVARMLRQVEKLTPGYKNKTKYYLDELTSGIAKIAAAFWPHDVIIRFSDFKTNEYRTLLGGEMYEPVEENPMLGWRGASRYYDEKFRKAFRLECLALKRVREKMGLRNVIPMVPFCRTVSEGKAVLAEMKRNGLSRARDKSLKVYVMCEIPSNVILANEFLKIFDGMSIGSNDLTQLTLGLDRDSGIVAKVANENDPAVKDLIRRIIAICRRQKKYIGICGQAPSDYPEFVKFLISHKIDSMSLNPDSVIKTISNVAKYERKY